MRDIFDFLEGIPEQENKDGVRYINWDKFPSRVVKMAQNPTFFLLNPLYHEAVYKDRKSLMDSQRDKFKEKIVRGRIKTVNTSVEEKFQKYAAIVKSCIGKLDTSTVIFIASKPAKFKVDT